MHITDENTITDIAVPSYMENAFKTPYSVAKIIADKLTRSGIEFDSIVVRGNSGIVVGPLVAELLKKNIVIVNKEGVSSHSERHVVYSNLPKKYIIVDDLVDTGRTVVEIVEAMKTERECLVNRTHTDMCNMMNYTQNDYTKRQIAEYAKIISIVKNTPLEFVGGCLYRDSVPEYIKERNMSVFDNTLWISALKSDVVYKLHHVGSSLESTTTDF